MPERTWILTGSPENFAATRELGFTLIVTAGERRGDRVRRRRGPPGPGGGDAARRFLREGGRLEHVRKWPAEHWTLAFQGQLRTVSESDARVLMEAMGERARTPA